MQNDIDWMKKEFDRLGVEYTTVSGELYLSKKGIQRLCTAIATGEASSGDRAKAVEFMHWINQKFGA